MTIQRDPEGTETAILHNLVGFRGKRWLEVANYYFAEGKNSKGTEYPLKTLKQNPIQRSSLYLRILDSLLGSSINQKISGFLLWIEKE